MSDTLIAWVRTVVPGAWSALVAWLVTLGLPDEFATSVAGLGDAVVFPVALGAVYGGLRTVEKRLPPWLSRVMLGSAKVPVYVSGR